MPDLTRRRFLTGAPVVAAGVAVGVALAPKVATPAKSVLTFNRVPFFPNKPVITVHKPPCYFWIGKDGIVYRAESHPPLNWQPT